MKTGASLEQAFVGIAGGVAGAASLACGIVLCLRRLGGAFQSPPGPETMLAATAAGVALILASDAAARARGPVAGRSGLPPAWSIAARVGLVLALAALAVPPALATSVDRLTLAAAVLFSGAAIAGPFVARLRDRVPTAGGSLSPLPRSAAAPLAVRSPAVQAETFPRPEDSRPVPQCPGHLVQRFERYEAGGSDCLRGTLLVAVPAGARTAHGHVGFCPSFRQTPSIEVSTEYDGVEAVVTAAEILPWGVRIECRLDEPAEEAFEIPVDILAQAPA